MLTSLNTTGGAGNLNQSGGVEPPKRTLLDKIFGRNKINLGTAAKADGQKGMIGPGHNGVATTGPELAGAHSFTQTKGALIPNARQLNEGDTNHVKDKLLELGITLPESATVMLVKGGDQNYRIQIKFGSREGAEGFLTNVSKQKKIKDVFGKESQIFIGKEERIIQLSQNFSSKTLDPSYNTFSPSNNNVKGTSNLENIFNSGAPVYRDVRGLTSQTLKTGPSTPASAPAAPPQFAAAPSRTRSSTPSAAASPATTSQSSGDTNLGKFKAEWAENVGKGWIRSNQNMIREAILQNKLDRSELLEFLNREKMKPDGTMLSQTVTEGPKFAEFRITLKQKLEKNFGIVPDGGQGWKIKE